MKRLIKCLTCGKYVARRDSHQATVKEWVQSPITGLFQEIERVGRICLDCSGKAGYKTRKPKEVL
ncbi:hypothetical protein KAX29_04905 [candidate division WOR-3 bacterium]|nr:hypothetical protein [candidate division WOR-3 bacterium]